VSSERDFVLDWKPYAWQAEALRSLRHRNVIVVARQTGKTVMLKYILMHYCTKYPNRKFGYVTPTKERSGEVFEEIYTQLDPGIATPKKTNRTLYFANGSKAYFRSIEQDRGLRGATWHGVIFDECQEMEGPVVRTTFLPFLSSTGGWAIFCGTPPDTTSAPDPFFFEEMFERAKNDPRLCCIWHDHRIRSEFDDLYRTEVNRSHKEDPRPEWNREYGAKFDSPEDGCFDPSRLNWYESTLQIRNSRLESDVIINVDPSFQESEASDPRAIVASALTAEGDLNILLARAGRWPYSKFMDEIFKAWDRCEGWQFPMKRAFVVLETNGPGLPFYHALQREVEQRNHPMRIKPVVSVRSKYNRILSLEPWVRDGRVWLRDGKKTSARDRTGFTELALQFKQFPRGLLHGNAPKGHHYDLLDALAQRTIDFRPPRRIVRTAVSLPSGKMKVKFEYDKATRSGGLTPSKWSFNDG